MLAQIRTSSNQRRRRTAKAASSRRDVLSVAQAQPPAGRRSRLARISDWCISKLGYSVVDPAQNVRKQPSSALYSEDDHLPARDRKKLIAATRDAQRNFEVASWAVRKHLDFVASFTFQCKNKDRGFRRAVEQFIAERSKAENFDVAARHPRRRFVRLLEARRVIDGDVLALKLNDGTLQAIESDRIKDPPKAEGWQHGVKTDRTGRALQYAVHARDGKGYVFERAVNASACLHHAHWDRFDQVRGITPFASGVARLLDAHETITYAVAKAKIAQLFGIVLTRNADDAAAPVASTTTTDDEGNTRTEHEIDFGNGPVSLDLDPGEDAKFLENKTPPLELVSFIDGLIALAIKTLDIPTCWLWEEKATWHSARSAALLYLCSAREKRADVVDVLSNWADWQFSRAIGDSSLVLPRGQETIEYAWVPAGVPWWNPAQEVAADIKAVEAGFQSRSEVVLERTGREFTDLLDELQFEEDEIRRRRIRISQASPAEIDPPDEDPGADPVADPASPIPEEVPA
jgi:capsid protein